MIYTTRDGTILDLTTPEGLRGLRIEIATRLGWKAIAVDDKPTSNKLIDPQGNVVKWGWYRYGEGGVWFSDEMSLWIAGMNYQDCPDEALLPNWPTDANAALTLCEEPHFITLWHTNPPARGGWQARMHLQQEGPLSPTPVLAICLAWLAYKDEDGTP